MAKSLLYRWFGVGKIPTKLKSELQLEGIIVADEGCKASITYKNFRGPGQRFSWKRVWFAGSIVLTRMRLYASWFSKPAINVPLSDERLKAMQFQLEDNGLTVIHDAALFHSDWSGTIEYRYQTEQAAQLIESLQRQIS